MYACAPLDSCLYNLSHITPAKAATQHPAHCHGDIPHPYLCQPSIWMGFSQINILSLVIKSYGPRLRAYVNSILCNK